MGNSCNGKKKKKERPPQPTEPKAVHTNPQPPPQSQHKPQNQHNKPNNKPNQPNKKQQGPPANASELMVILTTYYNPGHYKVRQKLYNSFKTKINAIKGIHKLELITVECAFGSDPFEVTNPFNEPFEIQVRASHPLSIKENLLNIAWQKMLSNPDLFQKCRYIAWIDHDIEFNYPEWPKKVRATLKNHSIVQLFRECKTLGIHNEVAATKTSFAFAFTQNQFLGSPLIDTGYAWATTKDKFMALGSFYQGNIIGLGDKQMAYGFIGNMNKGFGLAKMSPGFEKDVFEWVKKAEFAFQRNVGFVDMSIRHLWHGKPENRMEEPRWEILKNWGYDPYFDLVLVNGVLQLKPEKEGLIKEIEKWFKERAEDETFKPQKKPQPQPQLHHKPHPHHKKIKLPKSKHFKKKKSKGSSGDDGDDGDDGGFDGDVGNDGDGGNFEGNDNDGHDFDGGDDFDGKNYDENEDGNFGGNEMY